MGTLEQYKDKGKEICETCCEFNFKDPTPIMLPPAPKQTYIDLYMDEEGESSSKFDDDKRRQANYEVEVEVYRALETLPEDILVIHSFEYTHHQYRLCDKSHDRRNCKLCKGSAADKSECDFVVLGKNYIVLIEVKNVPLNGDTILTYGNRLQLTGTFESSLKQLERTKLLIKGLLEQAFEGMESEQLSIISLSAFPSTSRDLFQDMDEQTKKQILCKEDFVDFSSWWQKCVLGSISSDLQTEAFLAKQQEVKQVLVAIYSTERNQCNELKCSLGKCIIDISEELEKGNITFLSKNRPSNPNVVKASEILNSNFEDGINIFRDIIGVKNLTAEQNDAFSRRDSMLVINGPAGSGKTIILLAKIIQISKCHELNRSVLFIFSRDNNSCQRYQDTLKKANISNEVVVAHRKECTKRTSKRIIDSKQNNQVVIVRLDSLLPDNNMFHVALLRLIGTKTHVFVDDCQVASYWPGSSSEFADYFGELALTNLVWIGCDITQMNSSKQEFGDNMSRFFVEYMPSELIATLSLNLRNTSDISGILSKMREQLIELYLPYEKIQYLGGVFPVITPGHFVHGPRTVVHVIDKRVDSVIDSILEIELDKLCNISVPKGLQIGIVHFGTSSITTNTKNIIEKRSLISDNDIELCNIHSCYSIEYPAVIVLHDVLYNNISPLYLEISRARVYCSVILYTSNRSSLSEYQPLSKMLDKLADSVRIIRYD